MAAPKSRPLFIRAVERLKTEDCQRIPISITMAPIATAMLAISAMTMPVPAPITTALVAMFPTIATAFISIFAAIPAIPMLLFPIFIASIVTVLGLRHLKTGRNDLNSRRCCSGRTN